MLSLMSGCKIAAVAAAFSCVASAAVPEGWFLAGNRPGEYDCSIDASVSYNEKPATYLRSKPEIKTTGFGTLMQQFDATGYLGKRVRFSAFVKAENVKRHGNAAWAGLWMRVDGNISRPNRTLAFDNMHDTGSDRSIKGTKDWKSYSVVLDIPEVASKISLGLTLTGAGEVWLSGVIIERVGPEVKVTARPRPIM
jgi:hypothetical protein